MASSGLQFIGQQFAALPPGTNGLVLTIISNFPTVANAGVRVFRDDGSGGISQVGQGVVIDTSINTPQGDTLFVPIPSTGRFAVSFQGQATSINASGVAVAFELRTDTGVLLENFGGFHSSADSSTRIDGTAFASWPAPVLVAGGNPGGVA